MAKILKYVHVMFIFLSLFLVVTDAITPILTHPNCHARARSMRRAFGAKSKFDFVDGSIHVSTGFDPSFKSWNRCNMLVHLWIMNYLDESIAHHIVFLENAIDVWNELKQKFS
ncbi:uncharacterized protein [Medicago truncatula]|nr:uncharacterized protein LOC112419246 [Medicago truncatula]